MNSRQGGHSATPSQMPPMRRIRLMLWLSIGLLWLWPSVAAMGLAQQLDPDIHPKVNTKQNKVSQHRTVERYTPYGFQQEVPRRKTAKATPPGASAGQSTPPTEASGTAPGNYSMATPLTATVTHTLYLPPAMYGQWNVTGTLIESNAPDLFSPSVSDIWLLEREGNQVTVTNPVNGANATISVDKAEGNQATFHRSGTAGKHAIYQEIPTITVHGDSFNGQSLNKLQDIKGGQVVSEVYGIYRLEATRISAARARFHPESEQQNPDLEIEEVHR